MSGFALQAVYRQAGVSRCSNCNKMMTPGHSYYLLDGGMADFCCLECGQTYIKQLESDGVVPSKTMALSYPKKDYSKPSYIINRFSNGSMTPRRSK